VQETKGPDERPPNGTRKSTLPSQIGLEPPDDDSAFVDIGIVSAIRFRKIWEGHQMLYSAIVKKRIRQAFDHVNNHRWDELMQGIAPNVHHRFGGAHAIGGERHDSETLRRWFERLERVLPNLHLEINNIWVKGWPWHTMVFVQWDGTATLLNGDASYFNRGLHVITLRWGKIYALDVFEDSQEVARGLAAQAAAGLEEAVAEQIVS
jgi:ketosteroid isomerase-like protein